ncbi:MAG: hypothetical protein ACFE95_04360 [Candidatus Hodarchaeota archaeon]
MRKKLAVLLLSVFILTLLPVVSVNAKKPLYGTMDLQFNDGWPGPQETIPDWVGHIYIDSDGDGECEEYGMVFFLLDFTEKGSVLFFSEKWVIYEWIEAELPFSDPEDFSHGEILLWGYDEGLTTKNNKYHMTGSVKEAKAPFLMWVGRFVYMRGRIVVNSEGMFAPGVFRIN